jgi:gamma-glutamyl:cysteine ligase YbdK (ATP-grasp superfamily)
MGEDVDAQEFSRADRTRYREKVHRCLDVFERMLSEDRFHTDDPMTGLEVELNLVDDAGDPALKNAEVLEAIADPAFQTELGQFNIEINVPPARLREGGLRTFEDTLRRSLNDAEARAARTGAHQVMIGVLPTLAPAHFAAQMMSANPRYRLLSEQILHARGEDIRIDITGPERLITTADSILPEAACTSTQFHVQTSPEQFAAYWNASQAISSVQLAVGANSPYCLGKELWRETRIPLFEQAADTRSEELKSQGVRPRVWFGERWINSVFDLFEENVRYFPALLPITSDEDPVAMLEAGETPQLAELRLHNGTIYRWNRPVYDITPTAGTGGSERTPHLRVENRVLPAGPTVADLIANAAFYFGLVRHLAESDRPLWSQMSFQAAEENFETAAEDGIDATLYWPALGEVKATELVLRRLLPMAHAGLESWGVEAADRDRLLGIIEQRCLTGVNGASWFVDRMHRRAGGDRYDALRATLLEYRERMHTNEPVHTWD